jgi:hypothetical protein
MIHRPLTAYCYDYQRYYSFIIIIALFPSNTLLFQPFKYYHGQ